MFSNIYAWQQLIYLGYIADFSCNDRVYKFANCV
jgi:hypothetical protein